MFDTHAHLNFRAFEKNLDEVVAASKKAGVNQIVIPGTDVATSKRAVEIAREYDGLYAAVGIHPHHVFDVLVKCEEQGFCEPTQIVVERELEGIRGLLSDGATSGVAPQSNAAGTFDVPLDDSPEVKEEQGGRIVAVGEIGLDRHIYQKTKYSDYRIDERFMELQKAFFIAQLALAKKYNLSVIVHNRQATADILEILGRPAVAKAMAGKMVFHCCEPDTELLEFVKEHEIFMGVDGDVTYPPPKSPPKGGGIKRGGLTKKQEFVKKVPLELLVLETDSPFLLPEPMRSQKKFPNTPANLPLIADFVAKLRSEDTDELVRETEENGKRLFQILPNT